MVLLDLLLWIIGIKINGIDIHCFNVILLFLVSSLLYVVDCTDPCTPAYFSELVHFVVLGAFLPACWTSPGWVASTTVLAFFPVGILTAACSFIPFCLLFLTCIWSESFTSLRPLILLPGLFGPQLFLPTLIIVH